MKNPVLDGFENAPWLIHDTRAPLPETLRAIDAFRIEAAKYPFVPGVEVGYPNDATPDNMERTDFQLSHGNNLYLYTPKDVLEGETRVVFYIHGGGFIRGNGKWCRANAISLARYLGLPAYCNEYRCAPEYKYPAALDDAEEAWDFLVRQRGIKPENIILSGESAGGTFAMALTNRLKQKGAGLPCMQILLSPVLNLAEDGLSHKYNLGKDQAFDSLLDFTVYTGTADVRSPAVSPLYADFTGFPPTFFFADDTEIFVSDTLTAAEKLCKLGIRTQVYLTHNMFHVFPFEIPDVEESKRVYQAMRAFVFS